ncbi:MAG TPA: ribosome biogenesis GTPase Der [Actinomycetota bacterium]|nr:ribosome biogenesis GTPase Der [Actinomycetota bacterium]
MTSGPLPRVVVVGRPNVGKSTLVNRLASRRNAIVGPMPGLTRDRLDLEVEWRGRRFTLSDTGGLIEAAMQNPESDTIDSKIASKAMHAVKDADLVLFVVDAHVGATSDELALAKRLRKATVPLIVVANKVDNEAVEASVPDLWSLGLGEPLPVSSTHGTGSGDLLDRIVDLLPEKQQVEERPRIPSIALVGRPNVGKSSLFNQLYGEERTIVHHEPGTTRDSIDSLVEIDGKTYRFIDTAGIRRRAKTHGVEIFGASRTQESIRRADVAILVVDAAEGATSQDQRIAQQVSESGAGAILALNKWDLIEGEQEADRAELSMKQRLHFVGYAPMIRVSAKTGRGITRLAPHIEEVLDARHSRIPTGQLNEIVHEAQQKTPPPRYRTKNARILYATQAETEPPGFVLFANVPVLADSWLKFLERRLREEFGFVGTPMRFHVRLRTPGAGR